MPFQLFRVRYLSVNMNQQILSVRLFSKMTEMPLLNFSNILSNYGSHTLQIVLQISETEKLPDTTLVFGTHAVKL